MNIKGLLLLTTLSVTAVHTASSQNEKIPYWRDMNVLQVNKEKPHTTFMTYNDRAAALTGEYEQSKFYQLLNGTWKFYYIEDDRNAPMQTRTPQDGQISKFPATGKYRVSVPPSTLIMGMNSNPGIPIHHICRTTVLWVCIVGI